jgi:hypothetical protein
MKIKLLLPTRRIKLLQTNKHLLIIINKLENHKQSQKLHCNTQSYSNMGSETIKSKITRHIYLSSHSITICIFTISKQKLSSRSNHPRLISSPFIRNHSTAGMTIRGLLLDQPSRPPSNSITDQVLPMMLLPRCNRTTMTKWHHYYY